MTQKEECKKMLYGEKLSTLVDISVENIINKFNQSPELFGILRLAVLTGIDLANNETMRENSEKTNEVIMKLKNTIKEKL